MTRSPPTLTSLLESSVSCGALEFCLFPWLAAFQLEAGYEAPGQEENGALGFLARVRLWLLLLWGQPEAVMQVKRFTYNVPYNREMRRRDRRVLPLARRMGPLSYHILCRKGLCCWLQWLYNRTLIDRVRWCFRPRWRWAPRRRLAGCAGESLTELSCAAPLRPD